MRAILEMGADGFVTGYPDIGRSVIDAWPAKPHRTKGRTLHADRGSKSGAD